MNIIKKWRSISFVYKMIGALILGAIAGLVFGENVKTISWIGTLFVKLLQMGALPLIFFSLIAGIASMDDPKLFGRIGIGIMIYYTLTTAFAALVGIVITNIVKPGLSITLTEGFSADQVGEMTPIGETLLGMIPTNIFAALSSGTLVSCIVFGTFVGIAIVLMKNNEYKNTLRKGLNAIADLMLRVVEIVLGLAPFGVFSLIANTIATNGASVAGFLASYAVTIYLSLLIMFIIYIVVVYIFTKITPIKFLKKALPSFITAGTTCSSLASMPVNLKSAESFGLQREIYGFTIPLGAQINKDGTAILITSAVLAAGQAAGMSLDIGQLIQLLITVLIITTGIAGVPGGTIVLLTLFSTTFGFPVEVAAIIMGAFPIFEMGITASNIVGDLAGTVVVAYPSSKDTEDYKKAMAE